MNQGHARVTQRSVLFTTTVPLPCSCAVVYKCFTTKYAFTWRIIDAESPALLLRFGRFAAGRGESRWTAAVSAAPFHRKSFVWRGVYDEGELIRERKLADRTQPISGSHIGTQKTRSAAQPGKMKGADCELYPTILIERGRWFQTSKAHWRHEFITRA